VWHSLLFYSFGHTGGAQVYLYYYSPSLVGGFKCAVGD